MSDTDTKAATAKTAAAAPKAKAKRRNLTPAERIAKAEADLKTLREKAAAGDHKRLEVLDAKIKKATAKRDELISQCNALQSERTQLVERIQATEQG